MHIRQLSRVTIQNNYQEELTQSSKMATVSRAGRTSTAVKKARLEAERSKMSARMGLDYGCEETNEETTSTTLS